MLVTRASTHLDAGRVLEALHLVDAALAGARADNAALAVKTAALEQPAATASATNHSETMWLEAKIADVTATIPAA